MTPASEHLAHARAIRLEAPAQRQGAGCRNFSRLPARGGAFSLDILFYRTRRPGEFRSQKYLGPLDRPICPYFGG
jgi:hypothetical protein